MICYKTLGKSCMIHTLVMYFSQFGGSVGFIERTFEIGEIYEGTDNGGATITIRIAEHTELNEDCPNSWCYQEFLEVPREYLRFV